MPGGRHAAPGFQRGARQATTTSGQQHSMGPESARTDEALHPRSRRLQPVYPWRCSSLLASSRSPSSSSTTSTVCALARAEEQAVPALRRPRPRRSPWEIHFEDVPFRLNCRRERSATPRDDAVDGREAEPRALPTSFVVKEGFEQASLHARGLARSCISDREHNVGALVRREMCLCVCFVELDVGGLDRQTSRLSAWHPAHSPRGS